MARPKRKTMAAHPGEILRSAPPYLWHGTRLDCGETQREHGA